jgi:hyperosmotically inducible periplasmic protein
MPAMTAIRLSGLSVRGRAGNVCTRAHVARGKHGRMKALAATCVLPGALFGSTALIANDADTDRTHPVAFVKDCAITTEIKTKLAADHLTGRPHVHVDTDQDGVVWLTGSATSRGALDRAVSIAGRTEHVTAVHSDLVIKHDD